MTDAKTDAAVPPGGRIGILGGGQLARMTVLAAARLGYSCHVYCPEPGAPAAAVSAAATVAPYTDADAVKAFGRSVDVVTLDFENIPIEPVRGLAELVPVRPGAHVLAVAQDRLDEKDFANRAGGATTRYAPVEDADSLSRAVGEIGLPAILKTRRLGYDGKGQRRLGSGDGLAEIWAGMATDAAILEAVVPFRCEVSVIVARGLDGATASFDVVENRHANHILDRTIAPAAVSPEVAASARAVAERLATALEVVGLLAVEMFVTEDDVVLVNEIAPRPHNSGHWTIDACQTSQFEQLIRAICGLPLGATARLCDAEMQNLLGTDVNDWARYLEMPDARLHLYGKTDPRPGRKMGHVTFLRASPLGEAAEN